jgi:tRNA threonylcarbamoyladenosine biosynthesis protein TsaE
METIFNIDRIQDLDKIAKSILEVIDNQKKIVFFGGMGVGKTTLIKSICKLLNVQDIVTSPTFSVVNEYKDINGSFLYHFDFYRIKNQEELLDIGLEEYLYSDNFCFIEWPEKADGLLDKGFVQVHMLIENESRIIKLITL